MPKRKTDPTTGQHQLTYREQLLVNEFINNGGNGARAAAAAGYKAARLDQAAYQALHRECVQQHIRERIRESCVSSDEIIGTLVSHMRANPTEFFDESGNFSIEMAKQKGIGHLIKSISGTICDPPYPEDPDNQDESHNAVNTEDTEDTEDLHEPESAQPEPASVQTCKRCSRRLTKRSNPQTGKSRRSRRPPSFRIQLHSPLQAASILARLIGIDRHHPYRPLNQPATCNRQPATSPDFDPNALLQSLIEEQMKEHGLSREAVTNLILQVRPEFAKYLDELPPPPSLLDQLSFRDTGKILAPILDAIAFLKSNVSNPTSDDRVLDAYHQIDAAISYLTDRPGQPPSTHNPNREADLTAAIDRIISRLSEQERERLARLQLETLIRQKESDGTLTEPHALASTNQHYLPDQPDPSDRPPYPDSDTSDSLGSAQSQTHSSPPETAPNHHNHLTAPSAPATVLSTPATALSSLLTQEPSATLQPAQPQEQPAPTPSSDQASTFNLQPSTNFQLATNAPSDSLPATCNLQPATNSSPNVQLSTFNHQPPSATNSLESFNRTYSGITRPFQFGLLDNHFTEVIDHIMRDQSLTPQQAIDAIWLAARQSAWSSANLIDQCIADYAALHPRLAHAHPPVCARRPPSPPRYYRPGTDPAPAHAYPCPAHEVSDSDDDDCVQSPGILTSTQLFSRRPPKIRSG